MEADDNAMFAISTIQIDLDHNCKHDLEFWYYIYGQDAENITVQAYNRISEHWDIMYSIHKTGGKISFSWVSNVSSIVLFYLFLVTFTPEYKVTTEDWEKRYHQGELLFIVYIL